MAFKPCKERGGKSVYLYLTFLLCIVVVNIDGFATEPDFTATGIYWVGQSVYGMDWGDFDPCHPGDEVACLCGDGWILELVPNLNDWDVYELQSSGLNISTMVTRPTIDIGDVYSGDSGNEIVVEGPSYDYGNCIAMVYYDSASGWTSGVLFDSNGLTGSGWGARVGDFDSRYEGDEIFRIYEQVLDFGNGYSLRVLGPNSPVWDCNEEQIYGGEVGMDSGIGDFNPLHSGREIVVLTEMGPAYEVFGSQVGEDWVWTQSIIWNDLENAGWTVEIADIMRGSLPEIVYGTRYNNRIVASYYDYVTEQRYLEVLFTGNATTSPRNMWDIAVGNILRSGYRPEIVGVDDTGSVYLVDYYDSNWRGQTIWQDTDALYAVVVGDFLPDWGDEEILVAGQSGKITMLSLESEVDFIEGDFTGDGKVDYKDLNELTDSWLQSDSSEDIEPWPYGDDIVNYFDFAILCQNWLKE